MRVVASDFGLYGVQAGDSSLESIEAKVDQLEGLQPVGIAIRKEMQKVSKNNFMYVAPPSN